MNRFILININRKTLQIFWEPILRTFTPQECCDQAIKKSLLTASNLKEAVMGIEGVVVELHAAGNCDRHSGVK